MTKQEIVKLAGSDEAMIVMNRMREEIRAIGGRSPNSLAYKEAAKQIEELAQWVKDFLK